MCCVKSKKWIDTLLLFDRLRSIILGPTISKILQPHGIKHLSKLQLEVLDLECSPWFRNGIDNSYMSAIAKIKSLKSFNIRGNSNVTDEGICYLNKLVNLKYLDISLCKVTSLGFQALFSLPLEELYADYIYINNACLEAISKLTKLNKLSVRGVMHINGDLGMNLLSSLAKIICHDISYCSNGIGVYQ